MAIKDLFEQAGSWLKGQRVSGGGSRPELDEEGLISQGGEPGEAAEQSQQDGGENSQVLVKAVPPKDKRESLERLQTGFDKLVERLEGINEHLNRQIAQHEELMGRIEQLPSLLESFPAVVENQKQMTEQLIEQLKAASMKNQQFIESVEKIPTETAKQTDALVDIDHQLAAAADTDVQMAESFNNFNQTLDKLNQSTMSQTDGIMQMSKTFATSDRYLKYIITRQNRRFMWMFIVSLGVCVLVVLMLVGIVIYVKQ